MKKTTIIIASAILSCTAASVNLAGKTQDVPLGEAGSSGGAGSAMGFLIYDENLPVGWHSFPLTDASRLTTIKQTDAVSAGAMAKDVYYAQTYTPGPVPLAWNTVDVTTGELTKLVDCDEDAPLYVDMTYDYADKKLWAIAHSGGLSTMLCEVNTSDGTPLSTVYIPDKWLMTLACSYDGEIYALCNDGYLYKFDKNSGQFGQVGHTEWDIDYMQSMEFDHSTGKLYWAGCTSYSSCLYSIDTETGEAEYISPIGVDGEITGLYIPFSLAASGAPAEVVDFVVYNSSHGQDITLNLVLPESKVDGTVLESISGLTLEVDNEVFKSWTDREVELKPGAAMNLDLQVSEGFHTFKVYATNGAGNGLPVYYKTFIGEDLPASPANMKVKVDGEIVTISWDKVTSGKQGGYIDGSTLVYTVKRQPDDVIIAESTGALYCSDHADVMKVVSYEVLASTAKGSGVASVFGPVVIGSYVEAPYSCGFDNDDQTLMWSIVDGNDDGYSWQRIESYSNGNYMKMGANSQNVDDWLISPPVKLEAGKAYKIVYDDWCLNPSYPAVYDLTMGRGNPADGQVLVLKSVTVDKYSPSRNYVYLPDITETGTYSFGFHANWPAGYNTLYVADVNIVENTAARLTATVTDGVSPLAGAVVEFGPDKTKYVADAEGRIEVVEIEAGTYTVAVSLFGYESEQMELTFGPLEHKQVEIILDGVEKGTVSGRVLDNNGNGLPDASVYLHGYDEYMAVTDRDGYFLIEGAYRKGCYALDVHALNYESVTVDAGELAETNEIPDVSLKEKLIAPDNVSHDYDREKVELSWDAPVDRAATFRYDDGTDNYVHNMELSDVSEYTVVGVIYDTPAVFTSMSWNVWDTNKYAETVDVIVFDLDENGQPVNRILYEENGLESDNYCWHSCQFRHPIVAPRGAFFALRGDARLCMDSGGEDAGYPYFPDKMMYTLDYRTEPFTSRLSWGDPVFRGNLTLRAEGKPFGAPRLVKSLADGELASPDALFDVFRLLEGDENSEGDWSKLTSEPVAGQTFADSGWAGVAKGRYRYAVKAVYSDGYSSYPAFSGMVPRQLTSAVELTFTTNASGESAAGAKITLVGNDNSNSYVAEVADDGTARMSGVWEGSYKLTCAKKGFVTLEKDVEVSGEADYAETLSLTEDIQAPANLLVEETGNPDERLLRWNVVEGLFEDFEGHEDWTVNSPGEIGWSYIDGDGYNTYASPNYEFPNMRDPMAFIIINPSRTDGSMIDGGFMDTHSGERVMVSFATSNGEVNNDFFISPALDMATDFVVSFWARCYDERRYPETLRVGYSVSGCEADDFEWVGEPVTVANEEWKQFIVNLPKEARYVALNYISQDKYYVAIDDVFIGSADKIPGDEASSVIRKAAGEPLRYEVYLDGEKLTETTETQYLLGNLATGDHVAGVKSCYASGTTEMTTASFTISKSGIEAADAALKESVTVNGNQILVKTAIGSVVRICGVDGTEIASVVASDGHFEICLSSGVYVVSTHVSNTKIVIR